MPVFDYTASDRTGAIKKGELEAKDKTSATRALGSMGLFVLEIKPQPGSSQSPSTASIQASRSSQAVPTPAPKASTPKPPSSELNDLLSTVVTHPGDPASHPSKTEKPARTVKARWSNLQRALYLRQLSAMFEAGIPLHHATHLLTGNKEYSGDLQHVLGEVGLDLERGRLLSKSMERSKLFSNLIVSSVRIGEQSGGLDKILRRLADSEEQSVKLKRTIISRLTYPFVIMLIMIFGLVVLGHVMSRVMAGVPNFKPEDVPLFGLLSSALGSAAFIPVCIFATLLFLALVYKTYRTPSWRLSVESLVLRLPVAGPLIRRVEASNVTRLLSLLVKSGVTFDRALELCADPVWTLSFRRALENCKTDLRNGMELDETFEASGLFPSDVTAMITAGQVSGALEQSLSKAADYCSDQVERTLETALALLEPLLIGFLGIAIGGVILCTFVPVFNSIQTL